MKITNEWFGDPDKNLLALLRDAAVALRDAGLRDDLVTRAQLAGIDLPKPPDPATKWDRVAGMRRVAALLEREARPLSAREIAVVLWPGVGPARARGWLGLLVADGWLVHHTEPPHPKYVLGKSRAWEAGPTAAEARAAEVLALQKRLAELTGGGQ